MTIIGDEIQGLLQELAEEINLPPLEDDDVTANRLAIATGLKANAALKKLQEKANAGQLVMVLKRKPDGRPVQTFQRPVQE